MNVLVATGLENRGLAHLGHAHEGVRCLGRDHRIGRHFDAAVGAVFEAHWARQATGQLAVALAFGGARPDRAPSHEVADVLRAEQIEKLGGHGQTQVEDVQQELARHLQPLVHGKAAVQVRVVDVALPAHRGAGLFKIHTHHDLQVFGVLVRFGLQQLGIGDGLIVVMDRARPDHHDQAVVFALQHIRNVLP